MTKLKDDTNRDIKNILSSIVDGYIRCKKHGKILVVFLAIKYNAKARHANMLIFNYHRNEIKKFNFFKPKCTYYSMIFERFF